MKDRRIERSIALAAEDRDRVAGDDDVSVAVLRGAQLDPAGQAKFLLTAIPDVRVRCESLLEAGKVPPYGADYTDEHHSVCWRVAHIRQLANRGRSAVREVSAPRATTPAATKLPLPKTLPTTLPTP